MHDQDFKFNPSKWYLLILSLSLLASVLIVISLSIDIWIRLVLIAVVAVYGGHVFWKYGLLRSSQSIRAIRRQSDGHWQLSTLDHTYVAELRGDSTISGIVSVLRFKIDSFHFPVSFIVFRDSLLADDYRRLLVLLKMY